MSDWEEASLADLADYINGRAIKPEECSSSDGIPVIRIKQINDPESIEDRFCGEGLDEKNIARRGDLLFSWSATLKTILWQGPTGAINQHIFKVLPKEGIDKTFLHYLIDHAIPALAEESHGSTMKHIKKSALSAFHLQIPPLPEQKKIAEILSGIDTAIASIKTARAKLVLLKKSLSLKLLATTSGQGRQATFSDVCVRIQDGTHFSPQSKDGEHLYITSKNIRPGRLDLSSTAWISTEEHTEIYKRCPVKKGDVLLTKDGANTGNACLNTLDHEFSLLSSVAFIRPEPNQCDPNYMLQWIMSDMFQSEIQQGMSGNAIARLTLTKINNLPIYLPSLEKQKAIAGILLGIDNQCKSYSSKSDSLQGLKSAISSDLLSGRKRVSV